MNTKDVLFGTAWHKILLHFWDAVHVCSETFINSERAYFSLKIKGLRHRPTTCHFVKHSQEKGKKKFFCHVLLGSEEVPLVSKFPASKGWKRN